MASQPRIAVLVSLPLVFGGCVPEEPVVGQTALPEPAVFSRWPSVTDKPVPVQIGVWVLCRSATPQEAAAAEGPHARHLIKVRVSPEAIKPFRDNRPLPIGAMVIKEKHVLSSDSDPLREYAVMIKRGPGYYAEGGDWEYAYVTLTPDRKVSRGRLAECARCHSSVKDRDFLFRSYHPSPSASK